MPYTQYVFSFGIWMLVFWALTAALLPLAALIGVFDMLPYIFIIFKFAPFFAMLPLANRYAREFSDPPSYGDSMSLALLGAVLAALLSVLAFALFNLGGWVAAAILGADPTTDTLIELKFDRSLAQTSAMIAFLSLAIVFTFRTKNLISHKKSNSL